MKFLLITAVSLFFRLFNYALWIYVILSWFARGNAGLYNIYCKLGEFVEPLLSPVRRAMEPVTYKIGLDFSPIVLAMLMSFAYSVIVRSLYMFL